MYIWLVISLVLLRGTDEYVRVVSESWISERQREKGNDSLLPFHREGVSGACVNFSYFQFSSPFGTNLCVHYLLRLLTSISGTPKVSAPMNIVVDVGEEGVWAYQAMHATLEKHTQG
ncbi:hypothetical protein ACFX12_036155 [Malus domestica]